MTRELRIARLNDRDELLALATADHHLLTAPTHVFVKGGQLVGCASLGAIELVLPWFHTQRCSPRDSLFFIKAMENELHGHMAEGTSGLICVPFVTKSKFHPHIAKLGYAASDVCTITFKKVR